MEVNEIEEAKKTVCSKIEAFWRDQVIQSDRRRGDRGANGGQTLNEC